MFKFNIFYLILIISAVSAEYDEFCEGQPHDSFVNDPRTCPGFFHCADGIATPGQCKDGLYFNPIDILCDWPENVDCVDQPVTPPTPPTPSPTPPPTTPTPPTIECPATGSVLLAHPQSCTLFILCFGGEPMELECPPGKHFSEDLQTCADPDVANCVVDHTACHGVDDFGLIPSTVDCNEYFICFNSTSIRRNCAPDLHFNPIDLRCESRHTAGCLIRPNPEDFEPDCPQEEFFAILPHPYSCTHYFYCINGNGQLKECAPGFLFDNANLHCDYDINVVCELSLN